MPATGLGCTGSTPIGGDFLSAVDFGMYVINTIRTYGKEALPGDPPCI
jgi:hypothetical protein